MNHENEYRLDIYTWPACEGVDPQMRTSYYETLDAAREHVATQTEPFAYASLSRVRGWGDEPWAWEGRPLRHKERGTIEGTNGHHPAVVALNRDWPLLVAEVRRIHGESKGAMITIAGQLLRERHPGVSGYAEQLGWAAAA